MTYPVHAAQAGSTVWRPAREWTLRPNGGTRPESDARDVGTTTPGGAVAGYTPQGVQKLVGTLELLV